MKKILILNQNSKVLDPLLAVIKQNANLSYQIFAGDLKNSQDYLAYVKDTDIIISLLGPQDVDWYFEALFEAIYQQKINLKHFIMLSYAGIDDELTQPIEYAGITDRLEFFKQQRYAIKIVDEAEFPYTIIRQSQPTDHSGKKLQIFSEGQPMPAGYVSRETIANLIYQIVETGQYKYESIGILEN